MQISKLTISYYNSASVLILLVSSFFLSVVIFMFFNVSFFQVANYDRFMYLLAVCQLFVVY